MRFNIARRLATAIQDLGFLIYQKQVTHQLDLRAYREDQLQTTRNSLTPDSEQSKPQISDPSILRLKLHSWIIRDQSRSCQVSAVSSSCLGTTHMCNPNFGSRYVVGEVQVLDTKCLSHHTFWTRGFQRPGKGHTRDDGTGTTYFRWWG